MTLDVVLGCSTAPLSAAENLPCRRPQAPGAIPGRQSPADSTWGKMTRFLRTTRILVATMAAALALVLPCAAPAHAAGPRNCTELTGRDVDRVGCYELVWVDGVEVRMTFANVQF